MRRSEATASEIVCDRIAPTIPEMASAALDEKALAEGISRTVEAEFVGRPCVDGCFIEFA